MMGRRFPLAFFVLTFLLSLPLYGLNALAHLRVVFQPEIGALYISLLTLTPAASASILAFRRDGWDGAKRLWRRVFDCKRVENGKWYAPVLLLMPLTFLVSLGAAMWWGAPMTAALVPIAAAPAAFLFVFVLAAGEEVGWMGFAFEPMQARGGALRASLLLGVIWAVWHVPFFVFLFPNPIVLFAQVTTLVGARVLAGWIFNNAGKSVFAVILFHAVDNFALLVLPDIHSISPWTSVIRAGLVLMAALLIAWLWDGETLSRFRFARSAPNRPTLGD